MPDGEPIPLSFRNAKALSTRACWGRQNFCGFAARNKVRGARLLRPLRVGSGSQQTARSGLSSALRKAPTALRHDINGPTNTIVDFMRSSACVAVHPLRSERSMAMNAETKTSSSDKTAFRPFQVDVPEADLTDMRRRIKATRLPEKETVSDFSQGVQLAFIQALARYWATDYDWRKVEAQTERPTPVHHRDRWAGHPLHSRPLEDMKMRCRSSSPTAGPARRSSS